MFLLAYSSRKILWLSNFGAPPPTIMISCCPPLVESWSMSVNVVPSSVLTCHVYLSVPSEDPLAINIVEPLFLVVASDGLETIVAAEADSRKS